MAVWYTVLGVFLEKLQVYGGRCLDRAPELCVPEPMNGEPLQVGTATALSRLVLRRVTRTGPQPFIIVESGKGEAGSAQQGDVFE